MQRSSIGLLIWMPLRAAHPRCEPSATRCYRLHPAAVAAGVRGLRGHLLHCEPRCLLNAGLWLPLRSYGTSRPSTPELCQRYLANSLRNSVEAIRCNRLPGHAITMTYPGPPVHPLAAAWALHRRWHPTVVMLICGDHILFCTVYLVLPSQSDFGCLYHACSLPLEALVFTRV